MPGEAEGGAESRLVLRTLADKVNWLIDRAHPAGRGPYTNNEVADLIEKTTGVPAAIFLPEFDENQAGLLQQQVELLAMIRDAQVDTEEVRAILQMSPEARKMIAGFIAVTARDEARRGGAPGENG